MSEATWLFAFIGLLRSLPNRRAAESCHGLRRGWEQRHEANPEHKAIRRPLVKLHDALLRLHTVLIESERLADEKEVEPIRSPSHFFSVSPAIHGSPGCGRRNSRREGSPRRCQCRRVHETGGVSADCGRAWCSPMRRWLNVLARGTT